MKKLPLLLFFVVILDSTLFAGFGAKIEIGNALRYRTTGTYYASEPNRYMYTDIIVNYRFNLGVQHNIYSGLRSWVLRNELTEYSPFREIYIFGYKISYDCIYIDLQHFCNHAVYSFGHDKYWEGVNTINYYTTPTNQRWFSNKWGESITTIAIGFKFGDVD